MPASNSNFARNYITVRYNVCKYSYNKTVEILNATKSNENTVNHRRIGLFLLRLQ